MAASDSNQGQGHGTHFYILLWGNVNATSIHGKRQPQLIVGDLQSLRVGGKSCFLEQSDI